MLKLCLSTPVCTFFRHMNHAYYVFLWQRDSVKCVSHSYSSISVGGWDSAATSVSIFDFAFLFIIIIQMNAMYTSWAEKRNVVYDSV